MAVNERETQEPLYPKNHPYSSASAVGAPDEQDLLQAEVLDLRGRTTRAELRVEVLTRALKDARSRLSILPRSSAVRIIEEGVEKALNGGGA